MSSTESFSPAREPRKFEFEELAKATRYFSNEQLVGIGDFGDVYEGSLPGVKVNIAIKKLKYERDEKQEAEFKNQIKDFGTVSHPNLVKLLGYCCEEANRLLVLEFVPNKSLRFHLSDENRRSNLNWSKRMKIAVGSARGLAHLHEECYPKIIHGDIKSDNILLDNDFTPKVADFGLAKIFSEIGVSHIPFDQEEASIYIDPENYYFQNISEKSDVYSFGVILLELITGRRLLSKGQVDIVNWVRTRIIKGNSIKVDYDSFVDSALKEYDKSEMKRMIYCAAATLYSKSSKSRPTMEQIVGTLEGKISCEELWVLEGESEEFSQSFKRSDALLEATASPLLEETTSKSKSLTEGNPSETMILSQFRGKGAEISQSLNESDALEATASSLFEVVTEMTSESKSLIRGDSSETMIPAQFGETTSESKSLTEEDPSETMIPALFRGKSAEFSPPLMELDAQEATASSLFEVDTETSESKSLIEGDPFETMIPAQFREMRSLHKDYEAYELRKFTFPELAIATGHFTNARLLGSGGFGTVYRGTLRQGKEVAIKKLYFQLDGQQQEEIEKEINAVGNVRHENVVKLIGYCREDFDTLLVLEFVPNNSLRCHLNDEERRSNLKWSERMKIAIGSAKGLAYLHEECNPKIIHRDIKAEKILLDDNCEPKIAGFGFAKFFPETNSVTHISSCWKRTNVYADPEDYYPQKDENILQKISEKSDVYSFGVVLLELITGRKIFDEHRVDIVNWAKPFMFKGDSVEINYNCLVDSALKGDYIKSEMELMIYCAAVSVYRPSKLRPRMKQIVEALEGKMPSNELWVAEVNTGKASESRSSKAGDMSETTSSPFRELKEITEASNLHWSKATSSQGIEPEIMQIQEMHAKSHYSALEKAATPSETSLEATAHNVMPSSRLMKVYHILNEIMTRIGNPNISTIGVCGGEGVGKTTLLEALKIQPVIRDVFQFVIWVTVPKVPNPRVVQLQIARQLPLTDKKPINAWTLLNFLEGVKFFLILDGVQEFISLNTVGIPDPTPENGCKIVLTTRSEQVCDRISVDSKINLENLLCKLFWENVGESIYSSNLQPLARKVVDLCCYHSHAIFLMSKALKDESDVDVWNNAIETLNMQAASPEQELEHIMVNVLKFSYLRLPDDTTRRCLKNGALFFVNEKIARKSLIDNWISDDLTDTYQKGRNVLETLVTAGLLERSEDGQFFTLHEIDRCILLEYIVPTEEAQLLFLINGGMGLTKPPKVEQWEGLIEICLMDNDISELPISPSCPKLRKLFLERNYKLRIIPPSFFDNMPALQVLNLSRTSIKSLPESLFKLFNLRRLFLNHCVLITTLSSKVGELKQLEVLDLEGTEIMYLPKEVGQLTNLTCLEVSFFEPTSQRRLGQSGEIIPCGAISALSQLEELNIDMSYDDKRWNASAEAVVSEICKLESLHTLKVYFPKVKLLSHLDWNEENMAFPSLSYFKFTVGHLVERIISRVSGDTELELERHDRYLKYVNGEGVPGDIKKVLRHSTAFFLDCNSTISRLSDFGYRNMQQLKCLVAGQCNELQAIIGGDQIESSSSDATVGLVSLEYMHIYYMKNLRSIWEGPVNDSSFNSLKYLTLRTCPELTTVFTPRLLANFSNLEELTIRDCPKITTLVSCYSCDDNITFILPALKRISLHFLPKLTSISCGLLMAPMLELMSFQYCLNLKSLPVSKASNKNLRKIKGEESWWQELKWEGTHHDSWADIFVPID